MQSGASASIGMIYESQIEEDIAEEFMRDYKAIGRCGMEIVVYKGDDHR